MTSYRGNDLDLRNLPLAGTAIHPEGGSLALLCAAAGRVQPAAGAARGGPIAVDDLVIACCNGAHEVAQFYGSGTVRLEHLLHALTRERAAGDGLAALGIRVDALRRETAVEIASDMPLRAPLAPTAPTASSALQDVLRRAADLASLRRSPAGLNDLLRALLLSGPQSPAAGLLLNAATDAQQLERWRDAPQTYLPASGAEAMEGPAAALNARLERMEASLHALSGEIAADRKTILEGLVAAQGELKALRAEREQPFPGDGVPVTPAELGQRMAVLSERLAALDALAPAEPASVLLGRIEAMEALLQGQAQKLGEVLAASLPAALTARLDQLGGELVQMRGELQRLGFAADEREMALKASLAELSGTEEAALARTHDLTEIHEALIQLATNQRTLGDNLSTWRLDSGGDVGILSNRLQHLEETLIGLLTRIGNDVLALPGSGRPASWLRGNGLKRWLSGTGSALTARRRKGLTAIRQNTARLRPDKKS